MPETAAIGFDADLQIALSFPLADRSDLETATIGVSAADAEAVALLVLASDSESDERRLIPAFDVRRDKTSVETVVTCLSVSAVTKGPSEQGRARSRESERTWSRSICPSSSPSSLPTVLSRSTS